jgi:phenylacetic acid degradation operon negative regulatory protein
VDARSALFDLYGDHLLARGGCAPVAALVQLLAPLGIADAAVRTAVSRMVRQGWLQPAALPGGPGYAVTERGRRRLDEAAARIYRTRADDWDERWHLLVVHPVRERGRRERLRVGLRFLGYAPIADNTWVSTRRSPEVEVLLDAEHATARAFTAVLAGDAAGLVTSAWDLDELAKAYRHWLLDARALVRAAGRPTGDEQTFAVRSRLVHEWRKFLFRDPGLPRALLPQQWPGDAAAAFFDSEAKRLLAGSRRFVDACLAGERVTSGKGGPSGEGET